MGRQAGACPTWLDPNDGTTGGRPHMFAGGSALHPIAFAARAGDDHRVWPPRIPHLWQGGAVAHSAALRFRCQLAECGVRQGDGGRAAGEPPGRATYGGVATLYHGSLDCRCACSGGRLLVTIHSFIRDRTRQPDPSHPTPEILWRTPWAASWRPAGLSQPCARLTRRLPVRVSTRPGAHGADHGGSQ